MQRHICFSERESICGIRLEANAQLDDDAAMYSRSKTSVPVGVAGDLSARYDEVPYISAAFAPSRPDNLCTVGVLNGLTPAPVGNCRVLEIGCAGRGNLLPMAQVLPESHFIGIDLSPRQIEQGQGFIKQIGLQNVELRCQNLLEFVDEKPFDYIIAHGFYSWVPPQIQDQVMLVCQKSLAPSGLVYFSYNTLPGWHIKQISRDMMLFHSRAAKNSGQRIALAREMMALASANPPPENTPYSKVVRQLTDNLRSYPDWYLEHDELELVNDAIYFEDFVGHAQSHQLCYVAGAQSIMNVFQQLPIPLQKQLLKFTSDPVALEQYADFVWGTQYRDSIFCRDDVRRSQTRGSTAVQSMYVAARLVEQSFQADKQQPNEVRFRNPLNKQEIMVSDASLISGLRLLARSWPHAVSFAELLVASATRDRRLVQTSDSLSNHVLAWYSANIVELWTRPTDFISASPERPCINSLARAQAKAGLPVVNLRHEECRFSDSFVKQFIPLIDGTRDRASLASKLAEILMENPLTPNGQVGNQPPDSRMNAFLDSVLSNFRMNSMFNRA